jgi:CsoR family transcriptional regulator, copper-sensing transcriptional repressor
MLVEDKSYPEIVQQISAVRGALDSVIEVIVQDLVEYYVSQTDGDTPRRKTDLELKETVSNIL